MPPRELLQAFERTADGVYAVDHVQRIIYWNRAAERLLGYTESEVLGRACYDVIAGGDYAGHQFCRRDCPVIECARRGRASESYDVRTHRKSGEPCWINVSIVVLRGSARRSTITVHLFRDVTEQRRLQALAARAMAAVPRPRAQAEEPPARPLTRREAEVLYLLACGFSNERIAEVLVVSPTTARNHIEHLLAKLGVHSKLEAVVYAALHHLV